MKKYLKPFLIILLIITVCVSSSFSQETKLSEEEKEASKKIKVEEDKYKPAGVIVGDAFIKAGMKVRYLWGIMGPPDQVWAMRGKDNVNQDYVKLDYYSHGLSFDINSMKNVVQGILIEQNSRTFQLKNCPFRIGQDYQIVLDSWGEPERKIQGTLAYWRRGVYIGIDDNKKISHIFITTPGKYEDEKKDKGGKK